MTARNSSAMALIFLLAATPASAENLDIGEIVVSPDKAARPKKKTGSKVEIVTKDDLDRKGFAAVTEHLAHVPGISISSPGGAGQEASLAIRGLPKRYVKTLFNGIDISDTTAPQVQTSYQHLNAGGLDSIEVLKGSQGIVYGSEAIGGVIVMSTLGGIENGVHHAISAEAGSFGTVRGGYGLTAAADGSKLALNINGLSTRGISAADRDNGNTETDPYRNLTIDFAAEHKLSEAVSVFASALYIDGKAAYDNDFVSPPADDLFNTNLSRQFAGRAGMNFDLFDGRFRNTVSVQAAQLDKGLRSQFFDADYIGNRLKFDYQGAFDATEKLTLRFGADHERQRARYSDNFGGLTDDAANNTSLWAQAEFTPSEEIALTAGLRRDMHSVFGGFNTWRVTGTWTPGNAGTRLHGSAGTGFRAPSLYELYDPFSGNLALTPETSQSFDLGVEQALLDGRLVADVTGFLININDMITYSFPAGYGQTTGRTRSTGIETSLAYEANDWLDVTAAYTWTHSIGPGGARSIRVPVHQLVLGFVAKPAEKWTISANARVVADTLDTGNFKLDDYVLVDAKLAYQASESTELYVRGENLLNQNYQTARGYGTPPLGVFAGVKARF